MGVVHPKKGMMMLVSDDGRCFAFEKREMAVLTSVMASEEREGLAALWLQGSRAAAWATDGNRALMVEREIKPPKAKPGDKPVAMPAATAHHAAKTARNRDWIVIDLGGSRVSVDVREPIGRGVEIESFGEIDVKTRSKHLATCKRHDGRLGLHIDQFFPLHHRRGAKGATVPVNPALLGPVMLLGKVAAKSYVWINIGKAQDPLTFVATADGDPWTRWRLIVMPLRGSAADHPDHDRAPKAKPRSGSKVRVVS